MPKLKCMIHCRSRKSAEKTLRNITPYIEGKLFLKVNREKTSVAYINRGKCRFRIHPKSVAKMKDRIRELTKRNNGW